jgi:hypothetical protein
MIDGVDFTDPRSAWPAPGSARPSASSGNRQPLRHEIGGSAGGALSIVTKSGTNDLHGSAFGFFRDSSLRAKGELDLEKTDYSRQQFGGTIGGPITKDRVHFFGSFEQVSENNFVLFRPGGAYASTAGDFKVPFDQSLFYGGLDTRMRDDQNLVQVRETVPPGELRAAQWSMNRRDEPRQGQLQRVGHARVDARQQLAQPTGDPVRPAERSTSPTTARRWPSTLERHHAPDRREHRGRPERHRNVFEIRDTFYARRERHLGAGPRSAARGSTSATTGTSRVSQACSST